MEPQYATATTRYNNFSPKLKEALVEWELMHGIKPDDRVVFEQIYKGNTKPLRLKTTQFDDMEDAQEIKPLLNSFSIPSHESILDPGTGDFVQLAYFKGGYVPGKTPQPVVFVGGDRTIITVVPRANPTLYHKLVFSQYLVDNANPSSLEPEFGHLYRLVRPEKEVKTKWSDRRAKAKIIESIDTATMETLRHLAPKIGLPNHDALSDDKMRDNFAEYAEAGNHEKLGQLFEADETRMFQTVERAIANDVVSVDRVKNMWVFSTTQDTITPAHPERNTIDQLVGYLILESGQTTFKQIVQLTGKAEQNAPRKPGRPAANPS